METRKHRDKIAARGVGGPQLGVRHRFLRAQIFRGVSWAMRLQLCRILIGKVIGSLLRKVDLLSVGQLCTKAASRSLLQHQRVAGDRPGTGSGTSRGSYPKLIYKYTNPPTTIRLHCELRIFTTPHGSLGPWRQNGSHDLVAW